MGGDGGCSWRGTEQSGRGRYLGSRGGRRLLPGLCRSGCWSTPRGCALAARKDREGMETRTRVAGAAKSVQRTDGRSCCRASRPAHQDEPRWCGDVARAPRSLRPSPGGAGRELGSSGCTLDEVGAPQPGAAEGALLGGRTKPRLEPRAPGRGWFLVTFAWRRLEGPGMGLGRRGDGDVGGRTGERRPIV